MAENHVSTIPLIDRKPHRYQVDEGLDVRFLRHANSAHALQTLWRGLSWQFSKGLKGSIFSIRTMALGFPPLQQSQSAVHSLSSFAKALSFTL